MYEKTFLVKIVVYKICAEKIKITGTRGNGASFDAIDTRPSDRNEAV